LKREGPKGSKKPKVVRKKRDRKKRSKKRHDWKAYKVEFFQGDFPSLSEFARSKGIDPSSTNFRNKTKNWVSEMSKIQGKAELEAKKKFKGCQVSKMRGKMLGLLTNCLHRYFRLKRKEKAVDNKIDTELELRRAYASIKDVVSGLCELMPFMTKLNKQEEVAHILNQFDKGKYDIEKMALEFVNAGASEHPVGSPQHSDREEKDQTPGPGKV
jgi:hypothetical protein